MITKILNSKTKTITFAAFLIAASTLASGLLGVLKVRLLASKFGAGPEIDCYFAAFRIPDFVSATIITGGAITAFLPIFSKLFQKKQEDAWRLSSNLINLSLLFLFFLCLILWILAPYLMEFITPGFDLAQKSLTVSLSRIMFISPLIFLISSIFSGILQYFDRFLIYSLTPIMYNIGIIFGIIFLTPLFKIPIMGVACGVVLGALLHLGIQIPFVIKSGYKHQFLLDFKDKNVSQFFSLLLPRAIGQASSQINLVAITAISSMLAAGSISIFNFANNLFLFPVSMIGASFAVAAFPSFSKLLANGEERAFSENFFSSFKQIVFIALPLSLLMVVLRAQIVRIILGTGEFGWIETRLTAASLGVFSLGIVFSALVLLIVRVFFSVQDTKTPAIVSIVSVVVSIISSLLFISLLGRPNAFSFYLSSILRIKDIQDIRIVGLALAMVLSCVLNFVLLTFFLKKRIKSLSFKPIIKSLSKIAMASVIGAITTFFSLKLAVLIMGVNSLKTFWEVLFQLIFAFGAGAFAYIFILFILKSEELQGLFSFIGNYFKRKEK